MDTDGVFGVEDRVFILASGVNDVTFELSALVVDTLGEGALDSRIIRVHKVIINKLDDQGGFAD